jgi:hypothetical protein
VRDNQLFQLILPAIGSGLFARGIAGVTIMQGYQPTRQGAPTEPVVLLTKLPDVPRGHTKRDSVWDRGASVMRHVEEQVFESTFQVNALAIQDPADVNGLTAADLARATRAVMQSSTVLDLLYNAGVGILRVGEIRNTPFVDDKLRNEYNPSFDFTLTHTDAFTSTDPVAESVECNVYTI